jgi:hypothetical protein
MEQNVEWKFGTKKYVLIFFGFLLLLSDFMGTAVLHTDGQSLLVEKCRIAQNVESKQCRIRRHIMFKRVKNKCRKCKEMCICNIILFFEKNHWTLVYV